MAAPVVCGLSCKPCAALFSEVWHKFSEAVLKCPFSLCSGLGAQIEPMWINLEGLDNPISFDGAEALVPVLKKVLRGWTLSEVAEGCGTPRIRLRLGAHGYERRSPWLEAGTAIALPDPVDAVCDLLLDIERAYVEDAVARGDPALSILHAAAVQIGEGGLVIFPSTHATGKSLLTVALAHAGFRVFADDQLPIITGQQTAGIAPGFLPRLRRPLPESVGSELTAFIRSHAGPQSGSFRYVDLGPQRLAPLGVQAPIKGVVLLDRVEGAMPTVEPVSEPEVLKACVLQNFGRKQNALQVLDTLHALVQGAECVKLTYDDAPQAVALLKEMYA